MTTRRAFLALPLLGLVPTPRPARNAERLRETNRLFVYYYGRKLFDDVLLPTSALRLET